MEKDNEIIVLDKKDLTNHIHNVNKQELRKYWDNVELTSMIDVISNPEHRMLIQFLWMSALRISEAVSLSKADLDFKNYTIKAKWLKNRKHFERIVPMHPKLRDLLMLFTAAKNNPDKIFPISRQRAWQLCQKYLNGHPHQLRHSFAVHWLRSGGDIVTLHRILGHSKIQTTMEYLKIVPVDQGKELLKIQF
jgi:integrase